TAAAYQAKRFTFSGSAGDDLSLAVTALVLTPNPPDEARVTFYRPDGYTLGSYVRCYQSVTPGCTKDSNLNDAPLANLPLTGTYIVYVQPQGAATMGFNATLSTDVAVALTPGSPTTLSFDAPGRQAWPTFTATAGQTVALRLHSIATTPNGIGVGMIVYQPNGSGLTSVPNVTTQTTVNLPNLTAGTYSVLVAPRNA